MPTYRRIAGNVLFFLACLAVGVGVAIASSWAFELEEAAAFLNGVICGIPAGVLTANRIANQQHDDWMKGKR
jgi:hypothetical protein